MIYWYRLMTSLPDDEELTAKKDQYAPSLLEGFTVNDSSVWSPERNSDNGSLL